MAFEMELQVLKQQISQAQDMNELNYLRATNEKKYWWSSIFIVGLFYALNGDVGKMIISWILSFFTLGIYGLYIMYTSYRDQNEFNNQMEYAILQRTKELGGNATGYSNASSMNNTAAHANNQSNTFPCPKCGFELSEDIKFCPGCGLKVEIPQNQNNFCTNCGAKIMPDATFCHQCGQTIAHEEEVSEVKQAEVIELPEDEKKLIPDNVE